MSYRVWIAVGAAYAVVAVITFGHSAAAYDRWSASNCATLDQIRQKPLDACMGGAPIAGVTAAVLWPLYWSWELQS